MKIWSGLRTLSFWVAKNKNMKIHKQKQVCTLWYLHMIPTFGISDKIPNDNDTSDNKNRQIFSKAFITHYTFIIYCIFVMQSTKYSVLSK